MSTAVVYGDISPNVVDGSSIWLMSIAETLSKTCDEVHLQLKMKPDNYRLLQSVNNIDNVVLHFPPGTTSPMGEEAAVTVLESLVSEVGADVLVSRGLNLAHTLSESSTLAPILWAYITDLPFPVTKLSKNNIGRLQRIAANSRRVFVQTEAARSYLESIVPFAAGKTCLMLPMVPSEAFSKKKLGDSYGQSEKLRIVYAGKMAKDWKTLEMLDIPKHLKEVGIESELVVVGDKINRDKIDPSWHVRMKAALEKSAADPDSGVEWLGGVSREESMVAISSAHIGLGWRTAVLDSSLEVSTKALEYSALGTPALVNYNDDSRSLFGSDYPFFIDAQATSKDAADVIAKTASSLDSMSPRVRGKVAHFSMDSAVDRLTRYFEAAGVNRPIEEAAPSETVKVVIASHDFKFMGELVDALERDPRVELEKDVWSSLHEHDEKRSRKLVDWADVVLCEWCGPSVRWYAQNKRAGQRLISRLHGFELRGPGPWMKEIDWQVVDELIFVSQHYEERARERLPLQSTTTRVIPNAIDLVDFDREKLFGAQFHIGLVGYVPFLKRPDKAISFFEELLEIDDRYILHVRGRAPWEYPHEWKKPLQKQLYLDFFSSIASSERLREHVVFEDFGPDMASWFRKIGVVLSPSDVESFHLAPAEGMASRAVPIVWQREGSKSIFGPYVDGGKDSAINRVLELREPEIFAEQGQKAREYASRWGVDKIISEWIDALTGHNNAIKEPDRKGRI